MSERSLVRTAFPENVVERIGFYVYRLIDPRNGATFYVGKGTANRIFQHVAAAGTLPEQSSLKFDRIREIEASGERVRYLIHRHGLSESEALLVESALIDAYEELSNQQLGHGTHTNGLSTVDDLIGRYDLGLANIDIPAVLLNLRLQYERGLTPQQLYERTRGFWTLNPQRHRGVKYGIAVASGIIREVYEIESWEQLAVESIVASDLRKKTDRESKATVRWAFTGSVAIETRDRFVGKSFPWPSQGSFLWRNC